MLLPDERDAAYLWEMRNSLRTIGGYMEGRTEEAFRCETMLQDAVLRQLTVLGEAAGRVSAETRQLHPQIPWRSIVGLRNVVVHRYDKVQLGEVWLVATERAPLLLRQIEGIVPPAPEDEA
jgi:uncharacterized protein with HEPN domain